VADDKKIVSVRRGGQRIELHMDELLVGDIVDIT
jgi:magnesium-transporting ATPase (P-type)